MFVVEQDYDLAALTVLCRAARKTVRRGARILRGFVWAALAFGVLIYGWLFAVGASSPDDWHVIVPLAVLLAYLLVDDRLNAWVALRQMMPGTTRAKTVFDEDVYTMTTERTESRLQYDNITALAESERYFICFLGNRHGQLFDKQGFRQGDPDAFRRFLEGKTGTTFKTIK